MDDQNSIKDENPIIPQLPSDIQPADILAFSQIFADAENQFGAEVINPVELHFIPENTWTNQNVSLHFLHEEYFGRKNNVNRRFEHKLWNALQITLAKPNLVKFIGVVWVTEKIMKVYKHPFAKLLKISVVDGGLLHKQGNFTRHGFISLREEDIKGQVPKEYLEDVDYKDVILITHSKEAFTMHSTEKSINECKWDNPAGATRVASLKKVVMNNE